MKKFLIVSMLVCSAQANASDVFVKCNERIISFNQASQEIYEWSIDGNRLHSLCRIRQDNTLSGGSERTIHSYSGLICSVSDASVSVKYTWSRTHQYYVSGRGWFDRSRQDNPQTEIGLSIDRKTGYYRFLHPNSKYSDYENGACMKIDRPSPRPNKF